MAMKKFDDALLNQASNQAMRDALAKTAEERLKIMGNSAFSTIIAELRNNVVDKNEVDKLEKEINAATNKNEIIVSVIKKGGKIADTISKILKQL
jgi:hypothetical protein